MRKEGAEVKGSLFAARSPADGDRLLHRADPPGRRARRERVRADRAPRARLLRQGNLTELPVLTFVEIYYILTFTKNFFKQ